LTWALRDEREDAFGLAHDRAGGLGDGGGPGEAVQADRDVPEGGHDLGARAGAGLGPVLVERRVANVVDGVLVAPVATDDLGELGWGHSVEVEVGDRVDGLGLDLPITPGAPTVHPDGLPGVWEGQASRWAHDFDRPRLDPAVTGVSAGERHLHVFPWQRCEFAGQGRTVRFGDRPRSTPRVGAGSSRARPECALRPQ